jgi:protein TonB
VVKIIGKNRAPGNSEDENRFEIRNFDDLVFEHRNREYGAYQLRRKYFRVLLGGLILSSSIGILSVLIPFLARPREDRIISVGGGYSVSVRMDNLAPPPEQIYVPPAPPPPEAAKMPETVQYVPPVVVDTVLADEATQVATDVALASKENMIPEGSGSGFGDSLIPGVDGSGLEEPLFIVEVMPTFKGGDLTRFREWVGKRTNYPAEAMEKKIRGTVFLTFIVEKDGSVSNVTVLKGVDPLLDEEAVKAISDSPKWSPGLQRGQPVRVRFQIPLTFQY